MNITTNLTTITKISNNQDDYDTTVFTIILVTTVVVFLYCYCNHDAEQEEKDVQARSNRAQCRLEIRYGS